VAVAVAHVAAAADRMAELGVPVAFEWVHDLVPELSDVAHAAGLTVRHCPLLLLDPDALPARPPEGIGLARVDPDDAEAIVAGEVVAATAFGIPAPVAAPDPDRLEAIATALRQGHAARAVAWRDGPDRPRDEHGRPVVLAAGSTQRAAGLAEVVGVGTLPQARRRGLGGAITAALARHELDQGASAVFLSAADESASRVYQRVGFRRIGTAALAAPSSAG
jgi:ribosomal protein S18 acetylase RimI-like enzyme